MRTLAIVNQKGGCGKTTTAINLAGVWSHLGKRVLLVDMDPQSHCAAGLGVPETRIDQDVGDALVSVGARPLDMARLLWRTSRNLDLMPSRMKLAGLEASRGGLADKPDRERRLRRVLDEIRDQFDVCIIDCSPAIGLLTFNALTAADMVIVPVDAGFFALQGATKQLHTIRTVGRRLGAEPEVRMLVTMLEPGDELNQEIASELRRRFEAKVSPVIIRRDARLREAASRGRPIIEHAPGSWGAEDYLQLGEWLTLEAGIGENRELVRLADDESPALRPALAGVVDAALAEDDQEQGAMTGLMPELARRVARFGGEIAAPVEMDPAEIGARAAARTEDLVRRVRRMQQRLDERDDEALAIEHGSIASTRPASDSVGSTGNGVHGVMTSMETAVGASVGASTGSAVVYEEPAPPKRSVSKRMLGVHQTRQGTLFVYPTTLGRNLSIAAEFNSWTPTSAIMNRNDDLGVFEICIALPVGKWAYRLVVDGAWRTDPFNPETELNPWGDINSILTVSL